MKPEYVARKSAWKAVTFLRVVLFWLIIPLIIMIWDIIRLRNETIEFYSNHIVVKSGVLSRKQRKSAFMGVISVSVDQSLLGRCFDYGDVRVDVPGRWDINTECIKNPDGLVRYLENKIISGTTAQTIIRD